MIIPIAEIQHNVDHYEFKASYENALEYQLEKVVRLTKEVEKGLDEQEGSDFWYFADKKFSYSLETLVHNLSILTEYYHGWVVFSHIGTIAHGKTKYKPLRNDENLDVEIDKIFKSTSIGVLKIAQRDEVAYYESCKRAFLQAYEFLFMGRFHELYVLNNYLKHNMIAAAYAPKAVVSGSPISIPYLYINTPNDRLLNPSVYKCLLDHEIDNDGKVIALADNYFVNIVNATIRFVCNVGGFKVYNVNGVDYLKGSTSVGLSMESIVEMAHDLVLNIVKVFLSSSKGNETRELQMSYLVGELTKRSPKTLSKILFPDGKVVV